MINKAGPQSACHASTPCEQDCALTLIQPLPYTLGKAEDAGPSPDTHLGDPDGFLTPGSIEPA